MLNFDLLVHDLNGRDLDAYGRVCSTHAGGPGDLDGRMVYYKPDAASGGFEFAFALPFSNGLSGEQFVPLIPFSPVLDLKTRVTWLPTGFKLLTLSLVWLTEISIFMTFRQ